MIHNVPGKTSAADERRCLPETDGEVNELRMRGCLLYTSDAADE